MNPEELLRDAVRGFRPPRYPDSAAGLLRLDANTNMMGVNPAVRQALGSYDWSQYPTPFSDDLRRAIAQRHGVSPDRVIVGNGSDEIFDFITKAFLNPGDPVAVPTPSFVMHAFYGRVNLGLVSEVPLETGFQPDVAGMLETHAKLTILSSPNNPTGNCFQPARIEQILRDAAGIVLIDEAYAEYGPQNWIAELLKWPNLIVSRTMSKAYGLAGMRVGYAIASPAVIALLHRVKPPFTVNLVSERIAVAALEDPRFMEGAVATTREERVYLIQGLMERKIVAYPSDANFVLARTTAPSDLWVQYLSSKGILVRNMSEFPTLRNCVRITVGTIEQIDRLFAAIDTMP